MPTMSASSLKSRGAQDAEDAAEIAQALKLAAAKGAFIASLLFVLRVVFFVVTGETPSVVTSVVGGLVAAGFVGATLMLSRTSVSAAVAEPKVVSSL